jgi:hypothetical protein
MIEQTYQNGYKEGDEWAREQATPKTLREVADYLDRCTSHPGADWWGKEYCGPHALLDAIIGLFDWPPGTHTIDPDFLHGFAQ